MSFHNRVKPANQSKVSLPITPLLDMTFQLLFFFIMNFNPADQEGILDMALAEAGKVAQIKKQVEMPQVVGAQLDVLSDLTVLVRTVNDGVHDGEISALAIRNFAGKKTPIDGSLQGLTAQLTKMREESPQKDNIKVQSDGKLKVRSILKVMDACKKAGYTKVSMAAPEDFGR